MPTEAEFMQQFALSRMSPDWQGSHPQNGTEEAEKDLLYHYAYFELCETVTGQPPSIDLPPEAWFRDQVKRVLVQQQKRLHHRICVELRYCERRRKTRYFSLPLPLSFGIIGALFDAGISCGLISLSWMTTAKLLDEFCDC